MTNLTSEESNDQKNSEPVHQVPEQSQDVSALGPADEGGIVYYRIVLITCAPDNKCIRRHRTLFSGLDIPVADLDNDCTNFAFSIYSADSSFDFENLIKRFTWHIYGCRYYVAMPDAIKKETFEWLPARSVGLIEEYVRNDEKCCRSKYGYLLNPDFYKSICNITNYVCSLHAGNVSFDEVEAFLHDNKLDDYLCYDYEGAIKSRLAYNLKNFNVKKRKRSPVYGPDAFAFAIRNIADEEYWYYDKWISDEEVKYVLYRLTDYLLKFGESKPISIGYQKKDDASHKGYMQHWQEDYKKKTGKSFNARKISYITKILNKYDLINKNLVRRGLHKSINYYGIGPNNPFYQIWGEMTTV